MDPTDRLPAAPSTPDARPTTTRRRAVVALVRPCSVNTDVLRAGADLAAEHGCVLLVLGTLEPLTMEWVDGHQVAGTLLDAAHADLFATCVETLWDRAVPWGVDVRWGHVTTETLALGSRVDIVQVVHGSRRPSTRPRRLLRLLTGRLDRLLGTLDLLAV